MLNNSISKKAKSKPLNPNVLKGHEGSLLKTLDILSGYPVKSKNDPQHGLHPSYASPIVDTIPRNSIVMFVECAESLDDHGHPYRHGDIVPFVDVLYDEKVLRIFIEPKSWLRYFIPWPRGGFIGE